ncbi:hypothetical protein D3C78_1090590 [compost metagenome]
MTVFKAITAIVIRNILTIFAIVQQHFAVGGINGKGQRVVVKMPVFGFFGRFAHAGRRVEFVDVHRQQTFCEQHLLGIEQFIELVRGLLPRHHAGGKPGGQRQH